MSAKLFVGNLSWNLRNADLEEVFSPFGELEDVFVMLDRATGRSKGFGFVTFVNQEDAERAIAELHQKKEVDGRMITVDFAKPKTDRPEGRGRF